MGIIISLILIAFGAILTWAVNTNGGSVDPQVVGVILMIVGLIGGAFSLAFWSSWWGPGYFGRMAPAGGPARVRRRRVAAPAAPVEEVEEVVEERY